MAIIRVTQRGYKLFRAFALVVLGAVVLLLSFALPKIFGNPSGKAQTMYGTGLAEADVPGEYAQGSYYRQSAYYAQSGYGDTGDTYAQSSYDIGGDADDGCACGSDDCCDGGS